MKPSRLWAATGAVLLCSTSHVATAAIIPTEALIPASFTGFMSFNYPDPPPLNVQTFGLHTLSGPAGNLRLDSGILGSPFIHASVPRINDGFFGRVTASLQYDLVIDGEDASVPILARATGEVQGGTVEAELSGSGFALIAGWRIEDPRTGQVIFEESVKTPGQVSGSFSDSFDHIMGFDLLANTVYRVTMYTDVGIANGQTNGAFGGALAFIDPVFSVAAGADSGYSFRFSEGVGNTRGDTGGTEPTPVPEPASFALLLSALLPLRLLRKRPAAA